MGANSQTTLATHIMSRLRYAEDHREDFISSEVIARSVNTNPAFIRRILTWLHQADLVQVKRGRVNSGWKLARGAERITLLHIYEAVNNGPMQAMHTSAPNEKCPIGRGIQPILHQYYERAEEAYRRVLAETTLEQAYEEIMEQAEFIQAEHK